MLISHEVPICLLEESKKFNDYDYCLLHLAHEQPEYRDFYLNSIKEGRKVLLDNSMFELRDSLPGDWLAEEVLNLRPTWYVIPDKLNDKETTINRFEEFIKKYPNLPGLKIGVIQGSTKEEMEECYKYMSEKADKIAIPFGSKSFDDIGKGRTLLEKRSSGRVIFIKELIEKKLWNWEKPHHLLGCNLPIEFIEYGGIKNIESLDTSSPIVKGILGMGLNPNTPNKPIEKVADLINIELTERQRKKIIENVYEFKELINSF